MKIIITESQYKLILRESKSLEDKIYSKLKEKGKHSLTVDEREYLRQLANNEVDPKLEFWLNTDDENTFDAYGNKKKYFKSLKDKINDKIKEQESLTADEKEYLRQLKYDEVDPELEFWLKTDDENTFEDENKEKKLKFDEFDDDEDVLLNRKKTIRILNKHFGKSFSNNADWGGAKVWPIDGDSFVGRFIYYGDDELLYLKREKNDDDEYEDEVLETINNGKDFNKLVLKLKK